MEEVPIKRGRGRPKGSKNRPKTKPAPTPALPASGGITGALRDALKEHLRWCSCCDRPRESVAALARDSGVSHAILSRFLSGKRKGISAESIDRLYVYLHREDAP